MLIEKIGEPAMLEALAEECSELTQASLKLARYIRGENPTPKSIDDIIENFTEEIADVLICIDEIKNPLQVSGRCKRVFLSIFFIFCKFLCNFLYRLRLTFD